MELRMTKCRRQLATLWISGAGVLFFVVIFQTIMGHYGSKAEEAWGWLLPTIMPTLLLIVGVLMAGAVGQMTKEQSVDSFAFRVAYSISAFYLVTVALTIFYQPLTTMPPVELMKKSNLWLGPLQGLVSAAIGVFFVKGKSEGEK